MSVQNCVCTNVERLDRHFAQVVRLERHTTKLAAARVAWGPADPPEDRFVYVLDPCEQWG